MTKYSEFELPDGYGYNHIFKHQIKTRTYGLSGSLIPQIHKLCEGKWGWHFRPHKDMDYNRDRDGDRDRDSDRDRADDGDGNER